MLLFANVEIDAERFAQMAPEIRTQVALLAMERGARVSEVAAAVGLSVREVKLIASTTHGFRLSAASDPSDVDEDDDEPRKNVGGRPRGDGAGFKILDLLVKAGGKGLPASTQMLSQSLSISDRQVQRAMNRLLADGHIVRLKPSSGPAPAVWTVSDEGRSALDAVSSGAGR